MKKLFKKSRENKKSFAGANKKMDGLSSLILTDSLKDNLTRLKEILNNSVDIKTREFTIGSLNTQAAALYVDNLVKEDTILEYIVKPLMSSSDFKELTNKISSLDLIMNALVPAGNMETAESFDKIILAVLSGNTFLCIDGFRMGLIAGTQESLGRSIEKPEMEPSVKGSKESFVEKLKDNLGLIRNRLKDPNLTFEGFKVGRRTKTDIIIAYVKGIVNEDIVNEVRKRVQAIDTEGAVESHQVAQLINDRPNSIFPLIQDTERPDKVAASLLEGRIAILMDRSPNVLLVPVSLPILMQSVDDYYEQWILGSALRLLRYACLFTSALLPSLYIALTSFHPGMLPTNIVLSIAGTRAGVPFPAFMEALLMTATLEMLQEAGVRLPRVVGQTVSIVGGLVIGQAAVQAGVISPVMVIVIALTAISSFAIPNYSLNLATRILRLYFMLLATILGAVGTSIGLLILLGYACSLESFGVGFLEPFTPYRPRDWKDLLIRGPQNIFGKRPEFLNPEDTQRQVIKKRGKKE